MLSCVPFHIAEYFYSPLSFIFLTCCSIFVIFADSVIYYAGYDCYTADIIMWCIVPLIMILFICEYLIICRLFSCKVFNLTSCDFIYVFAILSLIVELTRITPKMNNFNYYSLDEYDETHHINNTLYWKHKLFDAFIEFIVFIRVIQSILRFVLYYIYGKEYRQNINSKTKTKNNYQSLPTSKDNDKSSKPQKNGYQTTAIHEPTDDEEDEDEDEEDVDIDDEAELSEHQKSCSSSEESPDKEPEPLQPPNKHQVLTIVDDVVTPPLPNTNISPQNGMEMPIMATRNSVDLLHSIDDDDDITPKFKDKAAKQFKLKLTSLTPLSPAQNNTTPVGVDQDHEHIHAEIMDIDQDQDNTTSPPFGATLELKHMKSRETQRTLNPPKLEQVNSNRSDLDIGKGHHGIPFNVNNMLSPPQIQIEPSDVDTQSIERIEIPIHQPQHYNTSEFVEIQHDDEDEDEPQQQQPLDHVDGDSFNYSDLDKEREAVMEETSDEIMMENMGKGENWGIFPMFAAKLGIIGDLCVTLIILFDHPYLFIVRICIFGMYFCVMMYISAHHFVQFIRAYLESHHQTMVQLQPNISADGGHHTLNPVQHSNPASYHGDDVCVDVNHTDDGRRKSEAISIVQQEPPINKQIKSIVLNPVLNNKSVKMPALSNNTTSNELHNIPQTNMTNNTSSGSNQPIPQQQIYFTPWTDIGMNTFNPTHTAFPVPKKDIEFRTGPDEIKKIIRNMLDENNCKTDKDKNRLNYESQEKLRAILGILQDIDVMEKGNIEEKIEYDEELDPEAKRWLGQTLLSKHSLQDSGITPHFEFNPMSCTAASAANHSNDDTKHSLITPIASHDTINSQQHSGSIKEQQSKPTLITTMTSISPQNGTNNNHSNSNTNCNSPKKLNVLNALSPQNDVDIIVHVQDDIINEDMEQNYTIQTMRSYDDTINNDMDDDVYNFDIVSIIEEKLHEPKQLKQSLIHLSPVIDKLTQQIMNFDGSLDTIELNRLTGRPLLHSSICIFLKFGFAEKLNINFNKFYKFIDKIESSYHCNNPYHNKMHATEVMMATMMFIDCLETTVRAMITTQQIFSAFISAIIHDVDHPGNNNAFEINTESDCAILYSDQSVLEFHHLQFAFTQLKKDEYNFTEKWDKQQRKDFRKQCVYSVLATDLSKHFDTISHIKQLKIIKETDLEWLFKSIIKMSDLSHVSKPLRQHKIWTNRITQEFHNQGDKELLNGLEVSPLCNKQNTKIAKGQVGFIKHVVSPLFLAAQRFFARNSKFDKNIISQLNSNRKYWEIEAKREESISQITVTTTDDEKAISISTPNTTEKARSSPSKIRKHMSVPRRPQSATKSRPQSATFSTRRIAILTNLDGTPPPILPSSVRGLPSYSRPLTTANLHPNTSEKYFFSPNHLQMNQHRSQQLPPHRVPITLRPSQSNHKTDTGDIGKGGNNVTAVFFQPFSKIEGKKRNRSSSAHSLELPSVSPKTLQLLNDEHNNHTLINDNNSNDGKVKKNTNISMLTSPPSSGMSLPNHTDRSMSPRSFLRLGSHGMSPRSTKSMLADNNFRSLTPKNYDKSRNTYNRMAISPNNYARQQGQYAHRRKRSSSDWMRTKSSEGITSSFDGNKIHSAKMGKYSKSDTANIGKSDVVDINSNNGNNIPLHVISPNPEHISPYSVSHDSKRLLNKTDDEHQAMIIHEEKSSSEDQHFRFEAVIEENQ